MAVPFRYVFQLGACVLWLIVIFILCALPKQDIPDPGLNIPHLDKVVHFGMFFIQSLLLCWWSECWKQRNLKQFYFIAIAFSLLYGGMIEILQYHFFNRGGDWWDLAADITGGVAGCLFYPTANKWKSRLFSKKRPS